ncbi:hypothetical protein FP2506_14349 [Fulvimarina pelagi HTCC2506]|uniref:Uncharacterized protein n=1 Tax=Fulvimarina pelagi HTCC2506 TaxID=314231 RepID=Q0G460_9HYPH|nr:hypothetical protein FP2506_14349 [Fulvimarina pelagi HTCC2506]
MRFAHDRECVNNLACQEGLAATAVPLSRVLLFETSIQTVVIDMPGCMTPMRLLLTGSEPPSQQPGSSRTTDIYNYED